MAKNSYANQERKSILMYQAKDDNYYSMDLDQDTIDNFVTHIAAGKKMALKAGKRKDGSAVLTQKGDPIFFLEAVTFNSGKRDEV